LSFFVDFSQILNVEVFLIALSSGLIYYLAPIVSVKALKNLPASMVFVNARIFSTVSILILSFLFFGESLNIKEFVGIVFGFIVFFLLIDRHEKVNLKASFKKGILFLFFYVILLSVVNMIHKTPDLSLMYNYLFIVYSFCFLMFLIDNIINKNIKKEYFKNKKIVLVSIFLGTVEAIIIILYL
jgi:drug/metabolite transporter (DMT)-like permease